MGTEWRRISGSTSGEGCADAPPGAEADGGSFSARRPARKLMDGGALGGAGGSGGRSLDRAGQHVVCGEVWIWVFDFFPD